MEYLDIYDENSNYLGKEERGIVHRDALWHNTVHCWLYDKDGNIFFQIRKDEGTLYTTASGHVLAGETIKEGFGREIKEEIGISIDYEQAILVDIVKFVLDKIKKDGSVFRDRAFANVYICRYDNDYSDFNFDKNELDGVVVVNAKETLKLLEKEKGTIPGTKVYLENDEIKTMHVDVEFHDFLVNNGETAITKYGDVLKKVVEATSAS